MPMKTFQVRAGLEPCQKDMAFNITTTEVQQYIQKKINVVVQKFNPELSGKVNITVYTTEAGRRFFPFVVLLPKIVIDEEVEEANDKLPGIYQMNRQEQNSSIKEPIMKALSIYCYTNDDKNAFKSDDWRRRTGVSRSTAFFIMDMIKPKLITKIQDVEFIQIIIDPVRVFHDMLKMEGDDKESKQDFYVEIRSWKKLKLGEYKYNVLRKIGSPSGKGKGGKNYKQIQLQEINAKFRNGR